MNKSASECAELFGVSRRQINNWIAHNGCPANRDGNSWTLNWEKALEWYVRFRLTRKSGSRGNLNHGEGEPQQPETYEQALLRKTTAEADLKELQLAKEQGSVAPIEEVERILTKANKAIQTQILALPSALAPQLVGHQDRNQVYALLDRACRGVLTNLATMDEFAASSSLMEDEVEDEKGPA